MGNVKDYREWLEGLLEESKQYPDDTEVVIKNDNGEVMMDGGGETLYPEEIMNVSFNGKNLNIFVTTDY